MTLDQHEQFQDCLWVANAFYCSGTLSGFKLGLCKEKSASGIWYKKLPVGSVALYTGQEPRISLYPHSNCLRPRSSVLGTLFPCCCLSSRPQTQTHHLFGSRRPSSLSMHLAFLFPTQICWHLCLCSLNSWGSLKYQ